eukprot:scaffold90296_cov68-Phaeocystis_antarctica.AAC.13
MANRDQRGSLSHRLAPTPHFGAPPLIYHPCQCRASAAAPGARGRLLRRLVPQRQELDQRGRRGRVF